MAYKYRKCYRIYDISEDGLLKVPQLYEGYGRYFSETSEYATEQDAIDRVTQKDLGDCVILPVVSRYWVKE